MHENAVDSAWSDTKTFSVRPAPEAGGETRCDCCGALLKFSPCCGRYMAQRDDINHAIDAAHGDGARLERERTKAVLDEERHHTTDPDMVDRILKHLAALEPKV